jgi:hypothetical protein
MAISSIFENRGVLELNTTNVPGAVITKEMIGAGQTRDFIRYTTSNINSITTNASRFALYNPITGVFDLLALGASYSISANMRYLISYIAATDVMNIVPVPVGFANYLQIVGTANVVNYNVVAAAAMTFGGTVTTTGTGDFVGNAAAGTITPFYTGLARYEFTYRFTAATAGVALTGSIREAGTIAFLSSIVNGSRISANDNYTLSGVGLIRVTSGLTYSVFLERLSTGSNAAAATLVGSNLFRLTRV